ncbi:hypothetical protein [Methylobacterium nigriterrae]|uniref:hypothetical protein n=1 Tax=Methylobacterium nigriterrae TaxID=3127512 RepID=UPI0030140993
MRTEPDWQQEFEHLLRADRLLADWQRRVADQILCIEEMTAKGFDTALAESLLRTMMQTLEAGHWHRQLIVEALTRCAEAPGARRSLVNRAP